MKTQLELLEQANDILRSVNAIIERKGEETNWEAISNVVKMALADQHELLQVKKCTITVTNKCSFNTKLNKMENNKNLERTSINETEKLHLFGVINSISPEILKELYQMAHEDGWNAMADTEYSSNFEVKGFDKVIEEIYKKYCL